MLITKRRLGSFDEKGKFRETMLGVARLLGGVCDNMHKSGISKHEDQYDLAYTMAHESGHLLECYDDGVGDDITGAEDCPSSDGYIMSGTGSHKHFWEFSHCCKRSVENKLKLIFFKWLFNFVFNHIRR